MTNRILSDKKLLRSNEVDEPETYHSRQQDIEAAQQDTKAGSRTRLATSGASYPSLPTTSPWSAQPDAGFHPHRDRIDPDDVCSNTFSLDVSGKSTPRQSSE